MKSTEFFLDGIIEFITDTKNVSKKDKPFLTRSIGLDTSVNLNGQLYKSAAGMQAVQNNCDALDNFLVGDRVRAFFSVSGMISSNDKVDGTEKNPKSLQCFTNLNLYKIYLIDEDGLRIERKTAVAAPPVIVNNAVGDTPVVDDDLPF